MKTRIKIDGAILLGLILLAALMYLFFGKYQGGHLRDNFFDALGFIFILKGILLRMSARGHKRGHSQSGNRLVTTGPYGAVRNPMYLGTFLLSIGFILIVFPWWWVFIFTPLFFIRFNKQICREEKILIDAFGGEYQRYCQNVPRLFPRLRILSKIPLTQWINLKEAVSTKECWGLLGWPLLALILENCQEYFIFGRPDTFFNYFVLACVFIAVGINCLIA